MRTMLILPLLLTSLGVQAEAPATYSQDIRPLWQARCSSCHGAASPYLGQWQAAKDDYKKRQIGPRMDSYAELLHFVGWPQSGALMRQLDDGTGNGKGKPGDMYRHLGDDETERQANLARFKRWLGPGAWSTAHLKPKKEQTGITLEQLLRIQAPY